jgi:hypothetical protein
MIDDENWTKAYAPGRFMQVVESSCATCTGAPTMMFGTKTVGQMISAEVLANRLP